MFIEREPIATYEQAVWRLCYHVCSGVPQAETDGAVKIVADVFWFSDEKVRADLSKALREIGGIYPPSRLPRRRGVAR
ncbi:MAG: hypothetical protein ACT4N9_04900 [Paracoccaceae bacterium]